MSSYCVNILLVSWILFDHKSGYLCAVAKTSHLPFLTIFRHFGDQPLNWFTCNENNPQLWPKSTFKSILSYLYRVTINLIYFRMLNNPRRLVCSVHMLLLYVECCRLPACQNQTDLWFSQRILTCSSYRQLGTNANPFFPLLTEKMVMSSALKSYLTFSCVSNRQPYLEQRVQ